MSRSGGADASSATLSRIGASMRSSMSARSSSSLPEKCQPVERALGVAGLGAGGQKRNIGARRPVTLRIGDRVGTVPGLACDGQRVSTNNRIARFLDERHPEPPLFPADPERRAAVEEVERWANDTLQMDARRILTAAVRRDPAAADRLGADGRLGQLLYRRALARRILIPTL